MNLSPLPIQKFFDNSGRPLNGGLLFTYVAGTTTKLATYQDQAGTPNTNPVVLNFRGEANVWLPANTPYKLVLAPPADTDPPGAPIWSVDQVQNAQLLTLYGGVDTGSANTYLLNFAANFSAYTDGIIVYFVPANTNTGPSLASINGLGAVPIITQDGAPLTAGKIVQDQVVSMIYLGGYFRLLSGTTFGGSFTATLTGVTGTVTGSMSYRVSNGIVSLYLASELSGTSNSAGLTITGLPASISNPQLLTPYVCDAILDNGINRYGKAKVTADFITLRLASVSGAAIVDAGFVASGTKGLAAGWGMMYQL